MYEYKSPFRKFIIIFIVIITLIIIIGTIIAIKNHNEKLENNNLDEETAEAQISIDIDCESFGFLENFSEDEAGIICAKTKDFVYDYNLIKYKEEYIGFVYVNNSFSNSSFKIRSTTNDIFTLTINGSGEDITLTPNPQLH